MAGATGTFLDRIIDKRRDRVAAAKARVPESQVRALAAAAYPAKPALWKGAAPFVIAEVKKASPSKGLLRADFDPLGIAEQYEVAGASAISVLTEEDFFLGSLDHLKAVRSAVSIPVLRKDFVFDAYQLYEGRAAGADLFLLIMAMLDDQEAADLKAVGEGLGMTALVEVHDRAETDRALKLKPALLGINNRNLRTFETTLDTTVNLLPHIPMGPVVVAESGLSSAKELQLLMGKGVSSFLIGETFMRAERPGDALSQLIAAARAAKVL